MKEQDMLYDDGIYVKRFRPDVQDLDGRNMFGLDDSHTIGYLVNKIKGQKQNA